MNWHPDATRLERFHTQVAPEPNTGCWLWTGSVKGYGYGQCSMNGRQGYAHRASWELYRGPIPDGMYVCHRCDVRSCVNPDHLFLGTHADNMADAAAKGRANQGVRNGSAKLTEDAVLAIRAATGLQREIAAEFGVSRRQVSDIRSGRYWAHVKGTQ